ncbi:hypothetical protein RJT34_18754 [Clitoria ternatea]|uniref:Uncharacterized protein n=1 Tax=Clitoria ternatea TaxID=43366 RepID=A0AAN9JBD5_CLITE
MSHRVLYERRNMSDQAEHIASLKLELPTSFQVHWRRHLHQVEESMHEAWLWLQENRLSFDLSSCKNCLALATASASNSCENCRKP